MEDKRWLQDLTGSVEEVHNYTEETERRKEQYDQDKNSHNYTILN